MALLLLVAAQDAVPVVLELLHLLSRPVGGGLGDGVRHAAVGEVGQLPEHAADADVHRDDDLLDRAVAIDHVVPHVAGRVDQVVHREVGGGQALQDLLVGRGRRLGRAATLIQQPLDRGAVDGLEGQDLAALGALHVDGRGIQDEEVLEEAPGPGVEVVVAIREGEEILQLLDLGLGDGLALLGLDRPLHLRDLVLPGLDYQPEDVQAVGQVAQLVEGHTLAVTLSLGGDGDVGVDRVVHPAAGRLRRGHRDQGFAGAEPVGGLPGQGEAHASGDLAEDARGEGRGLATGRGDHQRTGFRRCRK